jgi:hypothetical protein
VVAVVAVGCAVDVLHDVDAHIFIMIIVVGHIIFFFIIIGLFRVRNVCLNGTPA